MAVAGAFELAFALADERPSDDAADIVLVHQVAGDLADVVEALQAEVLFVRGDLEHGIRRRVDDRLAGADVLFAEFFDDRRARRVLVAENAGQFRLLDQCVGQLRRESSDTRLWK